MELTVESWYTTTFIEEDFKDHFVPNKKLEFTLIIGVDWQLMKATVLAESSSHIIFSPGYLH